MIACQKCLIEKDKSFFHKNKNEKTGYSRWCKECHSEYAKKHRAENKDAYSERAKKWRENNPNYVAQWKRRNANKTKATKRKEYLKRTYNISPDQYDSMRKSQDFRCYICNVHENSIPNAGATALNVDHDHSSGTIRKLLCMSCNIALGKVNDNISILEKMIDYLKEHKDV